MKMIVRSFRGLRRRRLWLTGAVALLLLLAHGWLLRGLGSLLTFEDRSAQAECVLVLGGDRCFERAAELFHAGGVTRVLLLEGDNDRLVQLGLVPSRLTVGVRELTARRVPRSSIVIVPRGKRQSPLEQLGAWLDSEKHGTVVVLCDGFESRLVRQSFDYELNSQASTSLSVHGLPDRRYSVANWWKSKSGLKAFGRASFNLAYYWIHGPEDWDHAEWNPEDYEESLR